MPNDIALSKRYYKLTNEIKYYIVWREHGIKDDVQNDVGGEKSEKVQQYEKRLGPNSNFDLCVGDSVYTFGLR